jgi:hypothetical protein
MAFAEIAFVPVVGDAFRRCAWDFQTGTRTGKSLRQMCDDFRFFGNLGFAGFSASAAASDRSVIGPASSIRH